jgi:arylsulfatase A-like enzyme
LQHGFDVDVPHHPGPGPAGSFVAPWKFKNFTERTPGEHIEDRMAAEAVAWMERERARPFFLNYWMFSVHAPFDAKKALIESYRGKADPQDAQRSPTYAAMVQSMDDAVGTLLDALDRLGIAERTVVIFFSDNGGNMYNQIDGTTPTSNRPLRGGKATLWEGGIRVPAIVSWPGVTAPNTRSDVPIQSTDFYPTILTLLGLPPTPEHPLDGVNVAPALRGQPFERGPMFTYFPHATKVPDALPPGVAVHRGDWKLIRLFHQGENGAHAYELHNLRDDLGETNNLASAQPALVKELDALIDQFLANTRAVVPGPNPAYRPAATADSVTWASSKDAKLVQTGGQLAITSSGSDPWIATRAIPAGKGPFTLKLRMKSTASGNGAVYFSTTAKFGFKREQSLPLAVKHDGQWHDYEVKLPVDKLTAVRVDPASARGEVVIATFELRDADGRSSNLLK